LLAACAHNSSPDLDSAAAAVDSSDSVSSEGNVMMANMDGADMAFQGAITSDGVATRIAANVALRWIPSSCATVSSSGSTVTITYNDCTGPRGLLHVTGTLTLDITVSGAGVISVHGSSPDFEVNGAHLVISLDATYSVSGTTHSLDVMTDGTGTGPLGNAIDHQGDYTVSWDTGTMCHSITGDWSTEFTSAATGASATRSNQVQLSRCAGGCPTGSVVHTGLRGLTLTLEFDGTNVATWTTSGGKSGTINLPCQ
jgi:hypothetical protein